MIHFADFRIVVSSTMQTREAAGAMRMVFDTDDPFAIFLSFNKGEDVWDISREQIFQALEYPTKSVGLGDVAILDDTDSGNVVFILSSPDGVAAIKVTRSDVTEFLDETTDLTPLGNEGPAVADALELFLSSLETFEG